jgi:hypothetical protein
VIAHATLEEQRKGERGAEIVGEESLGKPILINPLPFVGATARLV